MKHIKKFNEGLEDHIIDGERPNYEIAHHFADKLKDGFAILIEGENVEKFFKTLKSIFWIKLPDSKEYKNEKYYFILIGNRLLHSDKPYIGEYELEVYTPSKF